MLSAALLLRLGLTGLGLSYLTSLALKRLRGGRNPDPKLARLELLQLLGFASMLGFLGLLWLFVTIRAPIAVIYVLIGGVVLSMLLCISAYILAM